MRNPGGYGIIYDPDAPNGIGGEHDTFTCIHCNSITRVEPTISPTENNGWCFGCNKPICHDCAVKGGCTPWERQMERMEAKYRFLKSAGLWEEGHPL